jgi:phospholipase C
MRKILCAATVTFLLAGPLPADAQTAPAPVSGPVSTTLALLRQKVKYVFILYQENRSFDSYFGTYPGADGLFSQPGSQTAGFGQPIINTDGSMGTIHPFRIGPKEYAADTDDIDHSHSKTVAKMDIDGGAPKMDRFAITEERKYSPTGNPSLIAGPSTPGNLSIIAAQTGDTQRALHPDEAVAGNGDKGAGVPVMNDDDPLAGSPRDHSANKLPVNPRDFTGAHPYGVQINQTYASLPLTLAGKTVKTVLDADGDEETDAADITHDVPAIVRRDQTPVEWRWYQEGFDREPSDPKAPDTSPVDANGTHASYITHHNGPQYFGYIANSPGMRDKLRGLDDLFTDIAGGKLPAAGGVFYVKGGYRNIFGLKPADPNPAVQKNFLGDDDHPAYSDAQISEALVAHAVNAIARSRYWAESAIIITWDDSEGDYDHVPPPIRHIGPDGQEEGSGPRVPLLVISPYARANTVSHEMGTHSSVVKFVDHLFDLPPLATLPDELNGREQGELHFHQVNMGPEDALTAGIGDLVSAFDPDRLSGKTPPIPAADAIIPDAVLDKLPQECGYGCKQLGITPTDEQKGIKNEIPADFNPRPKTVPTRS